MKKIIENALQAILEEHEVSLVIQELIEGNYWKDQTPEEKQAWSDYHSYSSYQKKADKRTRNVAAGAAGLAALGTLPGKIDWKSKVRNKAMDRMLKRKVGLGLTSMAAAGGAALVHKSMKAKSAKRDKAKAYLTKTKGFEKADAQWDKDYKARKRAERRKKQR